MFFKRGQRHFLCFFIVSFLSTCNPIAHPKEREAAYERRGSDREKRVFFFSLGEENFLLFFFQPLITLTINSCLLFHKNGEEINCALLASLRNLLHHAKSAAKEKKDLIETARANGRRKRRRVFFKRPETKQPLTFFVKELRLVSRVFFKSCFTIGTAASLKKSGGKNQAVVESWVKRQVQRS